MTVKSSTVKPSASSLTKSSVVATKTAEPPKEAKAIEIVPAGGIARALDPDPIDEGAKKRALELVRYAPISPNHALIERKLAQLDPRAVAWAIEEYERQGEVSLYYTAKASRYDLSVLKAVTSDAKPVPSEVIPPAAAALVRKRS